MRVRFSRQCRADLAAIVHAISVHNPEAARQMARVLTARALALAEHPKRGRVLAKHSDVRRLVVRPYLILYRVTHEAVQVLRFAHGARDIDSLVLDVSRTLDTD